MGGKVPALAGIVGFFALVTPPAGEPARPAGPPTGRQLAPPWYNFVPDVPPDLVVPEPGAAALQAAAEVHAWNVFVALNWPASATQRGVPDRANVIGGSSPSAPAGPTVWETFKDADDVFLDPPVKPQPFNAPESIPRACRELAAADPEAARRTLTRMAKARDELRGHVHDLARQPLVDQNGRHVWYEVKVNEAWYDYVVNNGYYDSRRQPASGIAFPAGANDGKGVGALAVEAAWKVLGGAESRHPDDRAAFHTTRALVHDPATDTCTQETLGLVGLHIAHKTRTLQGWLWATFEQVDNAPTRDEPPAPGTRYNFFDPACVACAVNRPPATPTTPVQVLRVEPLGAGAAARNALFRPALAALRGDGNVWRHYRLVGAQWQQDAGVASLAHPSALANVTLETYLQDHDAGGSHGCLSCHAQAARMDFMFQLVAAHPRPRLP